MSGDPQRDLAAEIQDADLQIKRLQCDKLRVEIRDAALAWWQRPGYIASLVPIVIATAGVLSGWATGFFNRERELLKTEITRLTETKTKLNADNNQASAELKKANAELITTQERTKVAQRFIDDAYVKVGFHSAGTRYALSHIKPIGQEDWVGKKELAAAVKSLEVLPVPDRERLSKIIQQYELATELIDDVHKSMSSVETMLKEMPVSARAKRLEFTVDPNHDFVDPETKKSYTIKNIDEYLHAK